MRIAFDTETFAETAKVKRFVCLTWHDGARTELLLDPVPWVQWVYEQGHSLVGWNVEFDVAVLMQAFPELAPLLFEMYAQDRIECAMLNHRLVRVATADRSKLSPMDGLAPCAQRYLGIEVPKADTWRLRYGELHGVPLEEWPQEAKHYAMNDAVVTYQLAQKIKGGPDRFRQARKSFALFLQSAQGIKVDKDRLRDLETLIEHRLWELEDELKEEGLVRRDGSVNKKEVERRMYYAYDTAPPISDKGNIKTSKEYCAESGDAILKLYAEREVLKSVQNNHLKHMRKGVVRPRFKTPIETGRVSCTSPNLQNVTTNKDLPVRECFTPRKGNVFCVYDYSAIELCTLAQVQLKLFGKSKMAQAINAGRDLHLEMASQITGLPYEQMDKKTHAQERKQAKAANFGFPGGMGPKGFVRAQFKAGEHYSEEQATELREAWLRAWPEMKRYFRYMRQLMDAHFTGFKKDDFDRPYQTAWIEQFYSGRKRSGASYTAICNSPFQGLAADIMGDALWVLCRECYDPTLESVLYGSRPVLNIHDELVMECTPDEAKSERMKEIMLEAGRRWCPDVKISVEGGLTEVWSK